MKMDENIIKYNIKLIKCHNILIQQYFHVLKYIFERNKLKIKLIGDSHDTN
jgi:hypothetical protein